jgi:hypothetical protein
MRLRSAPSQTKFSGTINMRNMKKYILSIFVLAAFASCEETTNAAKKSAVTYLPLVAMNGEPEVELACDAEGFTDEGVTMTEGGAELDVQTVVTGTFFGETSVNGPDVYEIAYSAENKDGIPGTAIRTVSWPACNDDLNTGLAGMYSASLVRTTTAGAAAGTYTDVGPIIIKDLGDDVYQISDVLGGWYVFGRALGYTYGGPGATVKVNNIATDDFTHDDVVEVGTFGGHANITDFTVDPGTGTIVYYADWDSGYKFKVTLTQLD